MTEPGGRDPERRVARRYDIRVPVEYGQNQAVHGSGTTWNLSVSGVRIQHASRQVEVGGLLALRFSFFPGSFETPLPGSVVRHTEDGFAVQFDVLDATQIRLLSRALPNEDY